MADGSTTIPDGSTTIPDGLKTVPNGAREFRVMDHTGDGLKLTWNLGNPREVAVARETFNDYKRRGFTLFQLGEDDERGSIMTEFDPDVEGILAIPRLQGG